MPDVQPEKPLGFMYVLFWSVLLSVALAWPIYMLHVIMVRYGTR